jgi:phosphoenolpyruvate carboxylase
VTSSPAPVPAPVPDAPASPTAVPDDAGALRRDIRTLGRLLGETLVRQDSAELLALVEEVRREARRSPEATAALLDAVDLPTAIRLARAFSTYFHLANVTEQVHRARELHAARRGADDPLTAAARRIAGAVGSGELDREEVAAAVGRVSARPVFTAHPTEAARRSVLLKLRGIADLLDRAQAEGTDLADPRVERRAAELVDLLWQTDELRLERPEVLDEARNALYYLDDLAPGLPARCSRTSRPPSADGRRRACPAGRVPLTFGSWIGGDRDGNPFVTPEVTAGCWRPAARPRRARPAAVIDRLSRSCRSPSGSSPASRRSSPSRWSPTSLRCPTSTRASGGSTPRSPTASS